MLSRRLRTFLPLAIATLLSLADTAPVSAQAPSLYQRIGGYDAIARVVDDFFGRFAADPAFTPFLGGLNSAAQGRVRQNFIDYFCARAGGPCLYNGRDMAAAHEGLAIGAQHFDAVILHIGAALEAQRVPAAEGRELLALLRELRASIVAGGG